MATGAYVEPMQSLHEAVKAGDAVTVGRMLADGADLGARDASGMTPLHLAAAGGRTEVAHLLLAYGADSNAADGFGLGLTPLHMATAGEYRDIVCLLVSRGANIRAPGLWRLAARHRHCGLYELGPRG